MENYFGEIFVTLCPRLPLRIPALADWLVAFFSLATKAQRHKETRRIKAAPKFFWHRRLGQKQTNILTTLKSKFLIAFLPTAYCLLLQWSLCSIAF